MTTLDKIMNFLYIQETLKNLLDWTICLKY